ncbi:hypothetical protein F441_14820 [Phytophthora nicotianae CJ01A1]|nr:hypothetical protein F443_15010 [Phytophthora nicotianae P1569]ETK93186.1 hypothetical protein L915_03582 [Phytophthora nicotianae]ETM39431.1 hypothetical protein L914_14420 [Phytophthora nicotianae]ETO68148.1 hypothetical protein F444_14995 [Phytophthora nicotianae P1976]ETP09310.1 hypothetical protein F441_14820 [Phytophthora nicotianae CJ01A1]
MQLESVLTKLGLSRGVKRALSDDDLHTFTMYISMYNEKNPDNKVSLLETNCTLWRRCSGERADHRKDGP